MLVLPRKGPSLDPLGRDRNDVIVTFEVLSPSTEDIDLRWKRSAYTKLSSLTHYVVVSQEAADVIVFARAQAFAEQRPRSLRDCVELPSLAVSLPLSEIYRGTGLGDAARD